jgi:predicted enzyme related to lactoylglutathione lyase
MSETAPTYFECSTPIVRVDDMPVAVQYYVDMLGFKNASWGNEYFTSVTRDKAAIYLVVGEQGQTGSWVWIGVGDATKVHEELLAKGAHVQQGPRNYPWALEIHVKDPSGNILRMGSEPLADKPFDTWEP